MLKKTAIYDSFGFLTSYIVHTFSDPSEKECAAVKYARQEYEDETVSTHAVSCYKVKVGTTKGHEYSTVRICGSIDRYQINIADKQSTRDSHG